MEELEISDFIHLQDVVCDQSKIEECISASADIMFYIIERLFCSRVHYIRLKLKIIFNTCYLCGKFRKSFHYSVHFELLHILFQDSVYERGSEEELYLIVWKSFRTIVQTTIVLINAKHSAVRILEWFHLFLTLFYFRNSIRISEIEISCEFLFL